LVYNKGQTDQQDDFWDVYQVNGYRTNYSCSFGMGWTLDYFKPKYDIKPVSAIYMMGYNQIEADLVELLNGLGIEMSFHNCTNMNGTFRGASFTRVGDVTAKVTSYYDTFGYCRKLTTIDKWGSVDENGMLVSGLTTCFEECFALENITINGFIGNDVNFKWSKNLTKTSIENIINHLADADT
jgi:hypothetical protein